MNKFQEDTFRRLMWDYNFTPQEVYELLVTGERERLGHYTRETLFTKLVQGFSWYRVIKSLSPEIVKELLTNEVINKIRFPDVRENLKYAQRKIHELV